MKRSAKATHWIAVTVWAAVTAACGTAAPPKPHGSPPVAVATAPTVRAAAEEIPFFEGLGSYGRRVTTSSPDAQRYFDQGLAFLFGFNHDEATRSFREAARLDPSCAMAEWGIAVANGPNINVPYVSPERAKTAWEALERARAHASGATEIERALIDALGKRYAWPAPEDRRPLDQAYAAAMRSLRQAYRDDPDVGALFAEAAMDLRPWDLWTADGKPQPGTEEIVATLESVLENFPNHPLANHLYIHAVEASPSPGRADAAADRLRQLEPGLGHMVHMPSHIDVRRGRWEQAIAANTAAIEADRRYRARRPEQGVYRVYMAHNRHMLTFAAMMSGQSELAIRAIREMVSEIPDDWKKENAFIVDGFLAMPLEVYMRFGKWDEILAEPELAEAFPIARALRRYARGVAYAAKGEATQARAEQKAFLDAKAKIGPEVSFGNNKAADLLAVAEHLLAGEILYREGKTASALAEMRDAVGREDRLRYSEPPDWIQPVRHALGAALLKSGKAKDAEKVYREDLAKLPDNVWSRHGLARSLHLQKHDAEAKEADGQLARVAKGADIRLTSSCMCLPGI